MAIKKKVVKPKGLVKINQDSIDRVKRIVIKTKQKIGDFYEHLEKVHSGKS